MQDIKIIAGNEKKMLQISENVCNKETNLYNMRFV